MTLPLDTTNIQGGSLYDLIVPPTPVDITQLPPLDVTVIFTTVSEMSSFALTL